MSVRDWLIKFLQSRSLPKVPDGRPLFAYQLSHEEYVDLATQMRASTRGGRVPIGDRHWQACFCLLVSEFYRRDYPGDSGWSWNDAESLIDVQLTPAIRATNVKNGLRYWGRSVRANEQRKNYLGTLFYEGGLPWKLVRDESHGFGRAIGGGLAYYRRSGATGQSVVAYLERYGAYLPNIFDNTEIYELLAGIVAELSRLAGKYPELSKEADVVAYLDKQQPGWRARFPIPLGERNGRELVSSWLVRAVQVKQLADKEVANDAPGTIVCTTWLDEPRLDKLRSSFSLPESLTFETDVGALRSTRFTPVVYEGDRPVVTLTACYGRIDQDDNDTPTGLVRLRMKPATYEVVRVFVDHLLSIRIFVDGRRAATFPIDSHEANTVDLPLVFDGSDEQGWRWVGCTSTSISEEVARLYLPPGISFSDDPLHEVLCEDTAGGEWVDLYESTTVLTAEGPVQISVGNLDYHPRPEIVGQQDNRATNPTRCFLGFPRIEMHDNSDPLSSIDIRINGHLFNNQLRASYVGAANLSISKAEHGLLLRRRFGVLPKDLRVSLLPKSSSQPVTLRVNTATKIHVEVDCAGTKVRKTQNGADHRFELREQIALEVGEIYLRIASDQRTEPVVLAMPWPGVPARLLGPDGRDTERRHFGIDTLLGLRLVLSRSGTFREQFHIGFSLEGRRGRKLQLHKQFDLDLIPLELPLDAYREEFLCMFSARSEQDDQIGIRVETDMQHLQFYVSRFETYLSSDNVSLMPSLLDFDRRPYTGAGTLQMTDLTRPEVASTQVPENKSEGVGTGQYKLPEVSGTGPWIIHSGPRTSVTVRPYFVSGKNLVESNDYPTRLHRACSQFHPAKRPLVIDDVVAEMAMDFDHEGWDYLRSIKKNHFILPLSSFEAWRSVARSSDALVSTFLKLELDTEFAARMSTELAVIWETIPLKSWFQRTQDFHQYLDEKLQDDDLVADIVRSLLNRLVGIMPEFEQCIELDTQTMKAPWNPGTHYQTLFSERYQLLRRRQPEIGLWPRSLEASLRSWYDVQDQLPRFNALEHGQPDQVYAVCLLPPFMACVASGCASIAEFDGDLDAVKFDLRVLADFDRDWFESAYGIATGHLYHR